MLCAFVSIGLDKPINSNVLKILSIWLQVGDQIERVLENVTGEIRYYAISEDGCNLITEWSAVKFHHLREISPNQCVNFIHIKLPVIQ